MRLAIVTLALVSGRVIAQELGALPDCAIAGFASRANCGCPLNQKDCLTEFTAGDKIGDCARLDAKCICANDAFINGIACCLANVCDADKQKQAVDFARSFCSTQGVTDLPQSVTCASASGTSTPTSALASTTASASTTAPASTTTTTPTTAVTPNAGSPAALGSGAGFYGGLLAALAML
ncbi:hypothetical protein F4803DRAFT_555642 [Xylaria telfairii]|nr:hypothetical protein F4803DRAFT_555642 [Xylaria telfairii]